MRHKARTATGVGLSLAVMIFSVPSFADRSEDWNSSVRVSEFEGHIVFCAPQNPPIDVKVLPDGVEILTFENIGNVWRTGNSLVDGTEENTAIVRIDPASPEVTVRIRGKVDVAAVDGIWRFRQRLTVGPDNESSFGLGLGFGDLRGSLLVFEAGPVGPVEDSPCGVPFGVPLIGKVITFRWIT